MGQDVMELLYAVSSGSQLWQSALAAWAPLIPHRRHRKLVVSAYHSTGLGLNPVGRVRCPGGVAQASPIPVL